MDRKDLEATWTVYARRLRRGLGQILSIGRNELGQATNRPTAEANCARRSGVVLRSSLRRFLAVGLFVLVLDRPRQTVPTYPSELRIDELSRQLGWPVALPSAWAAERE